MIIRIPPGALAKIQATQLVLNQQVELVALALGVDMSTSVNVDINAGTLTTIEDNATPESP